MPHDVQATPPIVGAHPQSTAAADWEEVAAFLGAAATHGLSEPPRRIDTHAAVVFLAGPLAYKIKRPVKFPFLDFSTPARREFASRREIDIDRPIAPSIYRRLVAITREADGRLAIAGPGRPVEWAVEMHRFDDAATLDRRLARGPLEPACVELLAAEVARAENRSAVRDAAPWIADLGRYTEQNAEAFAAHPDLFHSRAATALTERTLVRLGELRDLLSARGRLGFVRLGHGDLHAGNIAVVDGRPQLFDAIEFDDAIATGDLLYDAGFLVMDLADCGDPTAACRLLSRLLVETARLEAEAERARHPGADFADLAAEALFRQIDGLAALGLFLSLRAAIRAKIAAARARHLDCDGRAVAEEDARRLFRAAIAHLEPARPRLVTIGGRSGAGKSTVAFGLAPRLVPTPGAVVLRSDEIRKLLAGVPPAARLPLDHYTPEVSARVYHLLEQGASRALAAGRSVIVDAAALRESERAGFAAVAAACEAPFVGLWLEVEREAALRRVEARFGDASDAGVEVVRWQYGIDAGAIDWRPVDAGGSSAATLGHAIAALG